MLKVEVLFSCFRGKKRRSEGVHTVTGLLYIADIYITHCSMGPGKLNVLCKGKVNSSCLGD